MRVLTITTVIIIAIFLAIPDLDLQVSSYFFDFDKGIFPFRDHIVSDVIYFSVRTLAIFTAIYFAFHAGENIRRKHMPRFLPLFKNVKIHQQKACLYIVAIIIITPGVLVHNVMKPLWDRARPVNIEQFGGTKQYTPAFHISDQHENSFPSGHSAMAFILLGFAFLQRDRKSFRRAYALIFTYGVIAAMCRVWQGGHFLSDVTVAALLSIYTAHIGYYLIFGKEEYRKFFPTV